MDSSKCVVGEEAIITADGNKIVKIPIRSLELPHFRFRQGDQDQRRPGQRRFESRRRRRPGTGRQRARQGRRRRRSAGLDYYEAELTVDEIAALIFEDLGLPFLQPKGKQQLESEVVRFTEVRRSGADVESRQAPHHHGEPAPQRACRASRSFGGMPTTTCASETWEPTVVEENNAVVIAMRDVSGSMGEFEKYITRSFYFWMVRFLRTKYSNVEIVFITHHTEAQRGRRGGVLPPRRDRAARGCRPRISSRSRSSTALPARAPGTSTPFHFSDGDNWGDVDNQRCLELVQGMLERCNAFGYGEIQQGGRAVATAR